ncbi:glycine oxidase maturase GoxB [Nisaea acidiphila]|uniref:Glycine oxidase maturase GoxB n=1 Tax=Nisaea acidiphila TaxID=1862145 RepID=A0A9J7ASP4_9PROT|nr:glycine oxidase maturase GoxB [Nisaea acidiphila]UUX48373.1 glycine oxidase maturase GoxB [Nisaea acidiphila]
MSGGRGPAVADIAVVGSGIAATAAVIRLLRQGHDPLWIAPELVAEDIPGEHLSPAARPMLEEIGASGLLAKACHRAEQSVFSAWGSDRLAERSGIVHLEGPGTVLDRSVFERDLRALAIASGAWPVAARLTDVSREDGYWDIEVDDGARIGRSAARFILDGSGRAAVVAGVQAPDHAARFRSDRLVALCAFLPQEQGAAVVPTRATLLETVPDGWWYACLLADGRLVLNFYTDPDLLPREATRTLEPFRALLADTSYVARWVEEAGFRQEAPPNLVSAGTTWLAPAAGEGWAAIGDAAAAFDPLSSHGMTTALWSGIRGAEAAAGSLGGDSAALTVYAEKVAQGVQQFLDSRAAVYGSERRFDGTAFWKRRLAPEIVPEKIHA